MVASMKPSPQNRGHRSQGPRNPPSRSDLIDSGKSERREQVGAEGRRAKSRARPPLAVSQAREQEAASQTGLTVVTESAQDFPAAPRAPDHGGSAAAETRRNKPILRQAPVAELLPAAIDQLWQANPLQKLLPIDWGAITQALSTLSARDIAEPVHATTVAMNLSMKLWRDAAETWM